MNLSNDGLPPEHYCIVVTSTVIPTYAELCQAYDRVSDVLDESRHILRLHESLREVMPVSGDKIVFLKKFHRKTTSEKAIKWAHANGYRLAFPAEREAFTKAHPNLQRYFWIVDLGSFIVIRQGRREAVVLYGCDGRRHLRDFWFGDEWDNGHRFLFVRK